MEMFLVNTVIFQKYCLTGKHTQVRGLSLLDLVPQLKDLSRTSFYSYKGSLTTPFCYQSVNWIVLKDPIPACQNDVRDSFIYGNVLRESGSKLSVKFSAISLVTVQLQPISHLIVSITKFSIMIGSPRDYLLRSLRAITRVGIQLQVSNLNCL